VKQSLAKVHSHLVNIPADIDEIRNQGGFLMPMGSPEQGHTRRDEWIDVAKELGAESVRCDPGKMNVNDLPNSRLL